jgi:hypothetical protein
MAVNDQVVFAPAMRTPSTSRRIPDLVRFWKQVSPEPNSGCWLWVGRLGPAGGALMALGDRNQVQAHRWYYEQVKGHLPSELHLRRKCGVRGCVRPEHFRVERPEVRAERQFWEQVSPEPNSGCWLWQEDGRAVIFVGRSGLRRRAMDAHRWAYERYVGPVPEGTLCVRQCLTSACVNPSHVVTATPKERARLVPRSWGHTRQRQTRLTPEEVVAIRKACAQGESEQSLATRYGVHRLTISSVVLGYTHGEEDALEPWPGNHPGKVRHRTRRAG